MTRSLRRDRCHADRGPRGAPGTRRPRRRRVPRRAVRGDRGARRRAPPRARGAAHRVGQVGGLLRRDAAAAPQRGAGPDRARLAAARPHARPDRGRRACRACAPSRSTRRTPHEWADVLRAARPPTRSTCCSSRPSGSTTRRSARSSCPRWCAASACSSSTRRTASATGATTSGPTTGGCATSSRGCPPACRCSRRRRRRTAGWWPMSPSSSAGRRRATCSPSADRSRAPRCGSACCACPTRRAGSAWLLSHLGDLPGSGIIYTLTVAAANDTARLLRERGHDVRAYTGQTDPDEREESEALLKRNEVKALVATSALGMGFDKPDLGFVVHLGAPSSPVAYYQQVGRAGPRHRERRRAAAARRRGPRHLALLRDRVDARPRSAPSAVIGALSDAPAVDAGARGDGRHPPHAARAAAQGARRRRCGAARAGRLGRNRASRGPTTPSATAASPPSARPSSST